MACSVWGLASVTDQVARGTEGRENRNRETSFSSITQIKNQSTAVNASNSRTQEWDLRAEPLDHTLFEMSAWLIVFQRRELGHYSQPVRLIYQLGSIFTCKRTDSSSFYWKTGLLVSSTAGVVGYRLNWLESWQYRMTYRQDSFVDV